MEPTTKGLPDALPVVSDAENAAIRAAEERQLALDIARLGTWEFNEVAGFIRLDARSAQVLGLAADTDLRLADFFAVIHPEDLDRVRADVERGLDPDGSSEYYSEHRIVHQDGTVRSVVARGRATAPAGEGATPGCRRFLGTLMDVTSERGTAASLRESEERFRALFQYSPEAIFLTVPEGRIIAANPAACLMFQMTEQEICERGRDGLIDVTDARQANLSEARRRLGRVTDWETTFVRKNGEKFAGETTSVILPGDRSRAFVVVRDVTERKRAEDALREREIERQREQLFLRTVIDAVSSMVMVRDADGRCLLANAAAARLHGMTVQALEGRDCREVRTFPHAALALDREVLATGRETTAEVEVDGADGNRHFLIESRVSLVDVNGVRNRVLSTAVDMSWRKRAEHALRHANEQLEEADRRKDEFIAILSHELRNPLAPIKYALPVLRRERLTDAGGRAAQVIDRQVDHLSRLVDDLLDVSRITRGKIELRREHVALGTVVSAAVEAASPAIAAAHHSLDLVVADEPIWLHADAARIAQVLTNLLDNSAKYTPPGGRIAVEAGRDNGHAVIRVRDNGVGIPPEALPIVFEMFRQVRPTLRAPGRADHARADQSQGGLGIGLALVKRLVEMHGGTIEARSAGPGQGSEFTVRLPVAADVAADGRFGASSDAPAAARRLKVLVVDDNADLVEMLAMLVETSGHDVRKALDGRSAISAALAYRPDVVLLDLGLPILGGLDVARELRRHPEMAHVRLVALTGWGQAEDRRQTREAGFDDHLTKPADPQLLEQVLARVAHEAVP